MVTYSICDIHVFSIVVLAFCSVWKVDAHSESCRAVRFAEGGSGKCVIAL